jgi:microcystin-dependent protein
MSENPFTDGQQFSAARLNSMYNAHQQNGVLNGLDASTSTNNFDVDVASGDIILNGSVVSASSTTVSHASSDPEDRIDLITVNSNGTISITQGSPAATSGEPVAPDIPTDEVLASLIYVRGGSSEILSGDIFNDYKTQIQRGVPSGVITMWSGAINNIPDGWALCDGNNGTPDLQDRFVVGAGNQYAVSDIGGKDEVQLTEAEMPSHTHTYDDDGAGSATNGKYDNGNSIAQTNNTGSAGGDEAHENRPPFYALAYIQKL